MVKALVAVDVERWGFFPMKRTAGGVGLAGFFQLYPPADQLDQIDPVKDLVNGGLGNAHGDIRDRSEKHSMARGSQAARLCG